MPKRRVPGSFGSPSLQGQILVVTEIWHPCIFRHGGVWLLRGQHLSHIFFLLSLTPVQQSQVDANSILTICDSGHSLVSVSGNVSGFPPRFAQRHCVSRLVK